MASYWWGWADLERRLWNDEAMRKISWIFDDELILWMCGLLWFVKGVGPLPVSYCMNWLLFSDEVDMKSCDYCNVWGVPWIEVIKMSGGKVRNVLQLWRISSDKDIKVCFQNYLAIEVSLWNALPISFYFVRHVQSCRSIIAFKVYRWNLDQRFERGEWNLKNVGLRKIYIYL